MDARLNWVKYHAFGKIVDIGCNEGMVFRDTPFASQVTGVDIDNWNPLNYGRFVQSDAANLPFANKEFDCAVLSEILEHVPDPVVVLKEAIRVAKCIVLSVPNEYRWSKNAEPFQSKERRLEKTPEGIAYTQSNQYCRGMVDDSTHPHLFHQRQFTREMLASAFVDAGLKYRIEEMDFDEGRLGTEPLHWSFYLAVAISTNDKWDDILPKSLVDASNIAVCLQRVFECGEGQNLRTDLKNKCLIYKWSTASRDFRKIICFVEKNHVRIPVSLGGNTFEILSERAWVARFGANVPSGVDGKICAID